MYSLAWGIGNPLLVELVFDPSALEICELVVHRSIEALLFAWRGARLNFLGGNGRPN